LGGAALRGRSPLGVAGDYLREKIEKKKFLA